jgi:uncharacterized DUF497 family protein
MAQFKFLLWLLYWYVQTDVFEFEWDKGNLVKSLLKHGVNKEEVESLFDLKLSVPIGKQTAPVVNEERYCILGPSLKGHVLSVVFSLRDGRVRPISARPASRKERIIYADLRKEIENV